VSYEWDWQGDGVYDASSSGPRVSHCYATAGLMNATVRVTDTGGLRATASIAIYPGVQLIDPDISSASPPCLALITGRPAIAYAAADGLRFVRALDASGSAWGVPLTVDPPSGVELSPRLAEVDSCPAIAFASYDGVYFQRASDPMGQHWNAPQKLDDIAPPNGRMDFCSLIDGTAGPLISYWREKELSSGSAPGELRFIHALDAAGSAWAATLTIDPDVNEQATPSLALVEGYPAVSYYHFGSGTLLYRRAQDAQGLAWEAARIVAPITFNVSTAWNSLAVVDGKPALVYFDGFALNFVAAADQAGELWLQPQLIRQRGSADPELLTLTVLGGRPVLTTDLVTFTRATDSAGLSWQPAVQLASGRYASPAQLSGQAGVCFNGYEPAGLCFAAGF
jgi:hypothetical protein